MGPNKFWVKKKSGLKKGILHSISWPPTMSGIFGGGVVVQNPFRVQLQSSGTTRLKSRVFSFQRLLISSQEIGLCEGGGLGGGGEREDLSVHLMPTFSRLPSGKFWWRGSSSSCCCCVRGKTKSTPKS